MKETPLEASYQHYRLLFERSPLPMWVFDKDTLRFLLVNESAVQQYGYSEEEFLNMTVADVRPAEEREKFLEYYHGTKSFNRLPTPHGIWKHQKKNGTFILVEITACAVNFQGKEAIATVINDVTQREQIIRDIQESEERFKLLSESSLEGIAFSENKIILDANQQFIKMFGYDNIEEIKGKNIDDLIHPKDRNLVSEKINELNSEPYELTCLKKDGSPTLVLSKGRILPYHGKNIRVSVVRDITRQKQYETALINSEKRFRNLFENNLAGVFRSEVGGTLVEYNQALLQIFGYHSIEEFKEVKAQQLYFSTDDRNRYLSDLRKKGFLKNYQMRMKKKDGSEIWILENIQLFKDESSGKEFIEGTLIDITETRRMQQALKESEENYKSLIEHTPDGILIHNEKGEVLFANPAALRLIGIPSLEAVADRNLFSYVMAEYHEQIRARKKEMEIGKDLPFIEIKIRRPDGNIVEAETKTSKITYGGMPAVEVVLHDISLQRQLEKEHLRLQLEEETNRELKREIAAHIRTRQRLRANERYSRMLIDSSMDMIFACDENAGITEFNSAAQKVFGYSFDEIRGKNISVLYADKKHSDLIGDLIFEKGNFLGEARHIKKNKESFPAYISASLLKNDRGEIIGTMTISRDITALKEAEKQLKKSVYEKEILLKEIHHRVKNNLQVISSILKLQSAYVKDPKTEELLRECRNRISSMAFIHSTLYMTKDFANINFTEYVSNLAGNLQQSYSNKEKQIHLELDVPSVNLHIDDAIPYGLIINELLSNSFKYAFPGRKSGTVGISVKVKKENIILAIWDNGIGFPKKINFRNTESLGLQLVVSLVEQLQGKIKLEAAKGTRFIIAFKTAARKN